MRFALIDAEKAEFPVRTMCRVLDVSESGFFSWKGRPASQRQRDDMIYLAHIRTAFELSNRTYGSPRMHRDLVDEGLSIGRRRTARLMRENGLAARQKRRFKRTTDSTHAWPIAPNLLDRDFAAEAPDQKWSADISYIWTAEGWLYLAVLIDLFSRRVVGWAVSDRLKKDLALRALRMALVTRRPPRGLIHHSDRGSQYCSIDYQAVLKKHGLLIREHAGLISSSVCGSPALPSLKPCNRARASKLSVSRSRSFRRVTQRKRSSCTPITELPPKGC